MTDSITLWVMLAVTLFWSVGAYNRLVRMRAQAMAAFQPVGDTFGRYLALAEESGAAATNIALGPPIGQREAEAASVWFSLRAASTQFDTSLRIARRQPLDANGMAVLQTARAALQTAWTKVHGESSGHLPPAPSSYRAQWVENDQLSAQATAAFNRAVLAYNAAIAQFPAVLLAYLFAFRCAGCL